MRAITTLILLTTVLPSLASAQERDVNASTYAQYMGDGMRFYAEGQYMLAVENLYRAYALRPDANTMKFIVRSYDLLGHCSAATRQLELFAVAHAGVLAPPLQQCARPATLQVECIPEQGVVHISPHIQVQCGQSIALPPGEYKLTSMEMEIIRTVKLAPNEVLNVKLRITPKKWTTQRLGPDTRVERLEQSSPYVIIMSPEGLYQVYSPVQGESICQQDAQGRRVCAIPRLPKPSPSVRRLPQGDSGVERVD